MFAQFWRRVRRHPQPKDDPAALRPSAARLSALIESASEGMSLLSAEGKSIYISAAGERVLGYSRTELLGRSFWELLHPDDHVAAKSALDKLLQTPGGTLTGQFRFRQKDGTWRWIESTGKNLLNDPEIQAIVVTHHDVTLRKQHESEIARLETFNREMIQSMTEGIAAEDRAGNFTFVNPAAAALLGYTPDELIGKHWTSIVPPDQHAIVQAANERRAQGIADRYELQIVRKDGARLSVLVAGSPRFENAQWAGSLAVFTDITERKRMEETLRANEELYRYATDATGQMIYDYNTITGQINWAGAIRAVTGYTPEEFSTVDISGWEEMLHPEDRARALEQLRQAKQQRREYHVEYRFRRKDSAYTCIEDWGVFLVNPAGQIYRMIGAMKDIAERKRVEEILRDREDRYRDLVEASPVIIILHDLAGNILSANPAAAQLLGCTTDEFTRLNVRDTLAPHVRDRFEAYLTTVQQNGYASGLMRVQTRAGEERILEYTSTLRTEGVSAPIVRAMARDVTELRRAEHAQARSAKQMAALYATSLEINAQIDLAQLLPTIVHRAADLVGARMGALYLMQPDNQTVRLAVSYNQPGNYTDVTLRLGEGVAGRVAQTGRPIMIEDYSQWEGRAARFANTLFRRILGVPIKSGNRVIGVLNVTDIEKTGAYQEEEIRLVSLFADQAAIAIENARLLTETSARADEFIALYETARDLMTQNDLDALLRTIVTRATTLLKSQTGSIFLYDAERGDLELVVAQSYPIASPVRVKLGEGMAGRVAQTRQPLSVENYNDWEHRLSTFDPIPFSAVLQVPMLYGGELIGVLDVSEIGASTRKFSETDTRLLSLFAAQAASAVYNARLLQQTQQRAEQLALLYDAVLTLNRAIAPRQVIQHLLEIASKSVHADRADFYRYDPETHTLAFESGGGYADHLIPSLRTLKFVSGEPRGLVGWVAAERTPLYLADALADPRWILIDPTIHSAYWVPVEREQHLFGVLVVTNTRVDAFTPADQRLVALFANQVAVALERAHLFQAEQTRRAELAALYDLSRALANTDTLATILDLVVQAAIATIHVTFARIALVEGDTLVVQATQPIRVLDRDLGRGTGVPLSQLPDCRRALEQNEILVLDPAPQTSVVEREFLLRDLAKTLCLVPLHAGGHALGLLMLGEARAPGREPFTADQMRLARSIGDQAASAIRRTKLHEQIEHRLSQTQALRTIDMTITASLDLNVTLDVFLTQVATQLLTDAAAILRYTPYSQMLEYVAGQGFRGKAIESSQIRLGAEYAGRAALERRIVSEPNLSAQRATLLRDFLCTDENFVSCVCVPLIAKGQIKGVLEIFYRQAFYPNSDWLDFVETLGTQAAIAMDNAELFDNLQRSNLELALAYDATIAGWSRTLELRDPARAGRAQRVTESTIRLARALGIREPELIHLRHGALLHDIGMLSVPDTLRRKRGALTPREKQIVCEHPRHAYAILSSNAHLRPIIDIPYCHHERWDGQGYPRGLMGEQIPLAARIFAVADAWDALTVGTPEQSAQTHEQAHAYLQKMTGKIFDPRVVKIFLSILEGTVGG